MKFHNRDNRSAPYAERPDKKTYGFANVREEYNIAFLALAKYMISKKLKRPAVLVSF